MAIDSTHPDFHRTIHEVIDTMNCGIVGRDMSGRIIFINDRLLSWLGYDRDEVEGKPWANLIPAELIDLLKSEIRATNRGDLRTRLTMLRRRDATTFPVLLIPQRLHDGSGAISGGFSVVVDVGAVQTAKSAGYPSRDDVRSRLTRIAMELQSLSLARDLSEASPPALDHEALRVLSGREKEVLAKLVTGDRVPAISTALHVSPHTVRNHLKSIFRKLDVNNQNELIRYVRSLTSAPL